MGRKNKNITIPKLFFNNTNFLISCLRGIIDTDFFISFDENYPFLGGWFSTKTLVKDLEKSFISLGLKPRTLYNSKYFDGRTQKFYIRHRVILRGKNNLNKWFTIINTHHPVLYIKYIYFNRGVCLKDKDIINNKTILDKIAPALYRSK